MRNAITEAAIAQGACSIGIARCAPVPSAVADSYSRWIADGRHAGMTYLERYTDIRYNPSLLLEGAKSILVCAFNYFPTQKRSSSLPYIAYYAYGEDYHDVLRKRLRPVADIIKTLATGSECRICVDTAPLLERYWAVQAGIGFIGRHSQLIVPGTGSYVLLGSIITTAELEPDEPCRLRCPDNCRRCIDACPGNAIESDGHINSRQCLSYLTIEHRGEFPAGTQTSNHLYGCDSCQKACPFNNCTRPTQIEEFAPSETLLHLTPQQVADMKPNDFSATFRHSAIKRAKLDGLRRNAAALKPNKNITENRK